MHRRGAPSPRAYPHPVRAPDGDPKGRGERAGREDRPRRRALLRALRDLLTVQALGGGSPELRPLADARHVRTENLTSEGGFASLPTVVTRLTARSFLPPPRAGLRGQSPRSKDVWPHG